jgi:hypothetical protein
MDVKEEMKQIAEAMAKLLPEKIVESLVHKALEQCLSSLAYQGHEVNEIVRRVVNEKATELLRTKYADQVNKKAEEIALQAVSRILRDH